MTGLTSAALFLLASLAGFLPGQSAEDLKTVRKVYVGSLGHEQSAELLRRDLIAQLKKLNRVMVVSSPREADAVLTGTAQLWIRGYYSLNPRSGVAPKNGTPVYGGSLSVELEGRSEETLWSYLVTPHFGSTDIRKDLCRELVRQLALALEETKGPSAPTPRH